MLSFDRNSKFQFETSSGAYLLRVLEALGTGTRVRRAGTWCAIGPISCPSADGPGHPPKVVAAGRETPAARGLGCVAGSHVCRAVRLGMRCLVVAPRESDEQGSPGYPPGPKRKKA